MAEPLIGPHRAGPLTLYHGMSANTERGAIRTALEIIAAGALYSGGDPKDTDEAQWVFQDIASKLTTPKESIKITEYLDAPENIALRQRISESVPLSYMIPVSLKLDQIMSGDFRSRTICFTEESDSRYHNYLAFEFALSQHQIDELEAKNFSGKSFFGNRHVRCTGDLPLTYCTRIVIGPYIKNPISVKVGLERSLATQNLRHIEVITPQSRASNNPHLLAFNVAIILILALGALLHSLLPEHHQ